MKKVLFSLASLFTVGLVAQNDLSISLEEPSAATTIGPGMAFDFQVTVSNVGTQDITATDTVLWAPRIGGNFLVTTQQGQQVPIVFFQTGQVVAAGSGIVQDTVGFGGLSLQNGQPGPFDFCGWTNGVGPNWRNVAEDNENNNEECNTVTYDPGNMSINEEGLVFGSLPVLDGSYYHQGTLNVRVYNLAKAPVQMDIVDLSGRTISSYDFTASGGSVVKDIDVSNLQSGVVLSVLKVDGRVVNTSKMLIQ
jgi:hypothetical protein